MNDPLVDYIMQARSSGLSDDQIKNNLLTAGHDQASTANAFAMVDQPLPVKKPFKRSYKLWVPLALAILILASFGIYQFVFANPMRVWHLFTQGQSNKIYNNQFKIVYADPNGIDSKNGIGFDLKNFSLTFTGTGYADISVSENPQSSTQVQYSFASGNTSFSTGIEARLKDKVLYLNVGDNPFLNAAFGAGAGTNQKIDWLKLDLNELQKTANQNSATDAQLWQEFTDPSFKQALQKIWDNTNFIKLDKYLGSEIIGGVKTYHFKNSIDKQNVEQIADQYIDTFASKINTHAGQIKPSDINNAKLAVGDILKKIDIQDFETWIGASDAKIYKIHIVSNAPSFTSIINNSLSGSGFGSPNDAKRLGDIRQLASALELYYNDHNGYPQKLGDLSPTYIGLVPTAPTQPDGNCSESANTYIYKTDGASSIQNHTAVFSSYKLSFCLGTDTGGYKAGFALLTPSGIQDHAPCPGNENSCYTNSNPAPQTEAQKIQAFVDKLQFNANFVIDSTYADYGKKKDLIAPSNAYDILQSLNQARTNSRDAKRIADIRQLASALELYSNDKNRYPGSLSELTPTYIGIIPTPPDPADGACAQSQNYYSYTLKDAKNYELTFCLGNLVGGYAAGIHKLTPAGIN